MYSNIISEGDDYRKLYADGLTSLVNRLNLEGYNKREEFMPIAGFNTKIEEYRKKYLEMLGIDKIDSSGCPDPKMTLIGEDEDCRIYRVIVGVTREVPMYGLLMIPHEVETAPLAICQHGGGGTPELCSDMNGKNNYNHIVRRLLKKGLVIFAPQLLLWNCREPLETQPVHPIKYDRGWVDNNLKRYGMSITGFEVKGIMNCISYLSELPFVDGEQIAMTGISYGGHFTLYTMAADTRIKAGYSNACFNDKNNYPWCDWSYKNSGNMFHDAEVAALCAPRKLFASIGTEDKVFNYKTSIPEAERVKKYYEAMGCPKNFVFDIWEGGHTIKPKDDGIDFMISSLRKDAENV